MSPIVRLVCYPGRSGAFSDHTALTLRIDLPDSYSPAVVVAEIQQRLRAIYPQATITIEDGDAEDEFPTWHVHRDGPASQDASIN